MKRLGAILALASLTACVSAQTFRSGTGKVYSPTRPESILVFYDVEDVKRPYEVIGEITTAGSTGWGKNEGDLLKKARKEAAKLGASAILVRPIDKGSSGDRAMSVWLSWGASRSRPSLPPVLPQGPTGTIRLGTSCGVQQTL